MPDWKTKILDETIRVGWIDEFISQGVTEHVAKMAINVLISPRSLPQLLVKTKILQIEAECVCVSGCHICKEEPIEETLADAKTVRCEYFRKMLSDEQRMNIWKKLSQSNKEEIIKDFKTRCFDDVEKNYFIDYLIKSNLIVHGGSKCVCAQRLYERIKNVRKVYLLKFLTFTDYMFYDLITTFNSSQRQDQEIYIRDLTEIPLELIPHKDVLFQRLATDFSYDKQTKRLWLNSPMQNPELTQIIISILERFIPYFTNLLRVLRQDPLLVSLPEELDKFQVIIEVDEIEPTPRSTITEYSQPPKFTDWKLEGTASENIIATGLFYSEFDNINESRIRFRTILDKVGDHPDDETRKLELHYGICKTTTTVSLGEIEIIRGRCLVFPNFLQTSTSIFSPRRACDKGVVRTLKFFLVDPRKRILSTADVKPLKLSDEESMMYKELLAIYQNKDNLN